MNRIPESARYGFLFVLLGAFVLGPLVSKALVAQPNNPPPPLKVLEQNLDATGLIRVHEQGTANVTVQGGSIAVSNLPSLQNVNLAPAATSYADFFFVDAQTSVQKFFDQGVINATTIQIFSTDEMQIIFRSPLSNLTHNGVPNSFLWFHSTSGDDFMNFVKTFPQPVPLGGLKAFCQNEANQCSVYIIVTGS